MIFETKEKDAIAVGEIKGNNISIDKDNIDFIVTILSTNLYSKPVESFIRETVSNAWDSHIEAGIDDPVVLELGQDTEGKMFCRIQDFGVGLSPERFDKIYRNIGSSTKRSDNQQIGGFGIGRFSALAYSDIVHITSVYDKKEYSYIMYKDGNSISIDLLNTQDTDVRNGLEVRLEIRDYDYHKFITAIKSQLVYFENLYVIDTTVKSEFAEDIEKQYNNFHIKKYKNFWVNTLDTRKEINLVLGKVRYPLRLNSLNKSYSQKIGAYPISLKFEIGDLEVTPNREEILYSTKNIEKIEEVLDKTLEEIDELIVKNEVKDFSKLSEYLEEIDNKAYLTLLETPEHEVRIKIGDNKRRITLNGEEFDTKNFKQMYKVIMRDSTIIFTNYKYSYDRISFYRTGVSLNKIKLDFPYIFLADVAKIKNISKRYIRDTFASTSYFIKPKKLRYYIKEYLKVLNYDLTKKYRYGDENNFTFIDKKALKIIFKSIMKNINNLQKFDDSSVPAQWIADTKAADKAKRQSIKKKGYDAKQWINLHIVRAASNGGGTTTDSEAFQLKDLNKEFKRLTVYAEKGHSKIRLLYDYFKPYKRPKIVEVAPTKMKLLANIENFVKFEDFMDVKYKLIRNIGTVELIRREVPYLSKLASINNLGVISERFEKVVNTLYDFVEANKDNGPNWRDKNERKELVDEIYNLCEEKNYFNEDIRSLLNANKKELKNAEILVFMAAGSYSYRQIPEGTVNIVVDYLLLRKLIRPSVKAVLKLRKETIFNIKSEENEDTKD